MKFGAMGLVLLFSTIMGICLVDAVALDGRVTFPYTNTFETNDHPWYLQDYEITNDVGWGVQSGNTGVAVIAASTNWSTNLYPYLPGYPHSNVLSIAGTVTNFFSNNSPDFAYIDVCVKPQHRSTPPPIGTPPFDIPAGNKGDEQNSGTSIQLLAYINSESNLVFYHLGNTGSYNTWIWSTNPVVIPSNEWVRLTIEIAYNNYTAMGTYYGDSFYRIKINGNTNYYTNMYSYSLQYVEGAPDQSNPGGGPREWFLCANCYSFGTPDSLHSFTVSGTVQIDDYIVAANAGISISSTNMLETAVPTSVVFQISLSAQEQNDTYIGFSTADDGIATNGLAYDATNGTLTIPAGQLSTSIVVNVLADTATVGNREFYVNVTRGFCSVPVTGTNIIYDIPPPAPLYTSRGTPYLWLDNYDLTNGLPPGPEIYEVADTNDYDLDGSLNWQEYWTGTNPTNPASFFKIVSVTTNFVLTWMGGTNDIDNPPPWLISRATNLLDAPGTVWTSLPSTNVERAVAILDSTNSRWADTDAQTALWSRVFYRITTTTNTH